MKWFTTDPRVDAPAARLCSRIILRLLLLTLLAGAHGAAVADTLDRVTDAGTVRCGVNLGLSGFARANSLGAYSGFDIDFCRAIAVAVLDDDRAIKTVPVSARDRFQALGDNRFDVLSRNTTWTLPRDAAAGEFVGTIYHDGQTFLALKESGLRSALQLDKRRLCVPAGSLDATIEQYIGRNELQPEMLRFPDLGTAFEAYADGKCDAVTGDRSSLAARRSELDQPASHRFLAETISKQPLSPMVRGDDERWENIVRWTLFCLINAEELGVSSLNIKSRGRDPSADVQNLLGGTGATGTALGLRPTWCGDIIDRLGNYGELYERHLGLGSPLGLERGINALWTNGGILYAPPMR